MPPNQKHQASHPSVDLSAAPAVIAYEPAKETNHESMTLIASTAVPEGNFNHRNHKLTMDQMKPGDMIEV